MTILNDSVIDFFLRCWVALSFIGLIIGWTVFEFKRGETLLLRWAAQNGYRLLEGDRRYSFRGPYFFTASKVQTVYHVIVEEVQGKRKQGWVRIGGWWLGVFSDEVDVIWDD